jgi:hypothetical protein
LSRVSCVIELLDRPGEVWVFDNAITSTIACAVSITEVIHLISRRGSRSRSSRYTVTTATAIIIFIIFFVVKFCDRSPLRHACLDGESLSSKR